ncbi:MAG: cyclase family protein [Acidimicrobiales bacterium]
MVIWSKLVELGLHTGTHIDAPGHFIEGGRTVDELRADELIMPLYVIDVRDRIAEVEEAGDVAVISR